MSGHERTLPPNHGKPRLAAAACPVMSGKMSAYWRRSATGHFAPAKPDSRERAHVITPPKPDIARTRTEGGGMGVNSGAYALQCPPMSGNVRLNVRFRKASNDPDGHGHTPLGVSVMSGRRCRLVPTAHQSLRVWVLPVPCRLRGRGAPTISPAHKLSEAFRRHAR